MKRILLFLSMLLCLSAGVYAQPECCGPGCGGGEDGPSGPGKHETIPLDSATVTDRGGFAMDPNELIGPNGYDSVRWVSINDILKYTILFENDPELATAPAMKVDVRFDFANKEAMKGFGLGGYGFANNYWDIMGSPSAYHTRLDLRDSMGIYVDLTAGLDVEKKQAYWTFRSLDPITGVSPWQIDHGMLPVNDSTHVGEGFVTFSLIPPTTMKTGDTISIVANIIFDQNDVISTNRWRNTIDAGIPKSQVKVKQDSKNETLHHIMVSGEDDKDGSGLKQVTLYQANNFGIYEEYAVCPKDTVIDFIAEPGHQYEFFALAEDNVGNREPLKDTPDFVINLNAAPTDIQLSDSIFQDDIAAGGFIAELTSEDIETTNGFVYSLAEGDGAIHNDLFQITGTQLQAKNCFKCAEDSVYQIRLSTTDEGGLSFSKAFTLDLKKVLIKPDVDTLYVSICEGETCTFNGKEYGKTGSYRFSKENEYMCDSVYVLNLTVLPILEKPKVSVDGVCTLVSSASKGNQWFKEDGTPVEGATEQTFTPEEDGIYYVAVSNGSCYSEPSQAYRVQMTDKVNMQLELSEGWNWISSNLSDAKYRTAKGFLSPVIENVELMDGIADELMNGDNGISGTLTNMAPHESYKLKMNKSVSGEWAGISYRPEETPITLRQGWNWIGYLPVNEKDLSDALSNLSPSENDVIKSLDDFAIYSGGIWKGTLTSMKPGEGYMYYTSNAKQLVYPVTRVFAVNSLAMAIQAVQEGVSPWTYNKHSYRDNMTIVAELYKDNEKALEGVYTVGAFINDKCRGIGRYVDGLLYLTIHGTLANKEKVTFKAYENATARELVVSETLAFDGMQTGTISTPYQFHITNETGILNISSSSFNIYPNPVRNTMYISGNIEDIEDVKILDANGRIVVFTENYSDSGINVSSLLGGVYVVAIHTSKGYVYKKIMIVN